MMQTTPRSILRAAVVLGVACAIATITPRAAQAQAGTIRGTVTDTTGRPIRNAEVLSVNGERSTRTDGNGRYTLTRVPWGSQLIMARSPGYRPSERIVSMLDESAPTMDFVLAHVVQLIDTVRITSHDHCVAYDFEGFECRRKAGIGQFRGEAELRALRPMHWADMFEGLPGFRRAPFVNNLRQQDWTVQSTTGWRCLMEGWNGRHRMAADELITPGDIVAVEHYDVYERVPEAYKRLAWPNGQDKPCALIMYWTRPFLENKGR